MFCLILEMCFYILHSSTVITNPLKRGSALSVGVKVRDNENIDRALRRFKRAVNRSRVLRIFRANMAYTKPSEEKRLARQKAVRSASRRTKY